MKRWILSNPNSHIWGEGTLTELLFVSSLPDGQVIPLVELSAKQVAFHIPFEVVEKVYPPVPEQLQLRIAYWSFPENEEDIR